MLFFAALAVLSSVLAPPARAARKRQTIVLALDQSGSMVHSDPERLRIEAAGLLAAVEDGNDRVGIIGFGDTARWLQRPVERNRFNFKLLDKIGATDAHTSFAPVMRAIDEYLSVQPSPSPDNNDVSLVLLTDGRSDPAGESAATDRAEALAIAARNADRLKIYTIGLGNDLDGPFLDQLAQSSHGLSILAASAADLPDAFLRVAARIAGLPVYLRSADPTRLAWSGNPQRVVAVFTGANAASAQIDGTPLYRSAHVVVAELDPARDGAKAAWTGKGSAFLCVQEPLMLSADGEFPAALLTDAPQPIALHLRNRQGPLKNLFFLENASAHVELVGADREAVPLYEQGSTGGFAGQMEAQTAGVFGVRAVLDSPYGSVETFLGNLTASVVPVGIPQQVSAGVFDPLPRAWFPQTIQVQPLLPVGAVHLTFSAAGRPRGLPATMLVAPDENPELKVVAGGAPGSVHVERYSATWTDGTTEISRTGTLRILTNQMSFAELLRAKWQWAAFGILLIFAFATGIWKFWPRPLQADLIVRRNGAQVLRLELPAQLRTRMLHVAESESGESSAADRAVIAGPHSRELLSLQSARRHGRWTIVAHPGAARVPAQQGKKWTEIDLRAIHVPVFYTDDGTIQINVLHS